MLRPNFLNFLVTFIPEMLSLLKVQNIKFETPIDLLDMIDPRIFKIGTSWSTTEFINRASDLGLDKKSDYKKYLELAFDFMIKELKVKTIRIGCYWDRIEKEEGKYILDEYLSTELEILSKYEDISFILNLGPFKTFRWPESYIPEFYKPLIDSQVLEVDSPITIKATNYLKNLAKLIKSNFPKIESKLSYVQFDNEPFNLFGDKPILISTELEAYMTNEFYNSFNKNVMVDGPLVPERASLEKINYPNLAQILDYISVTKKNANKEVNFITALNYYFDYPGEVVIPILNFKPDHFYLFNTLYPDYAKLITQNGKFMVSEGQFEPWGDHTLPGNSFQSFGFLVYRISSQYKEKFIGTGLTNDSFEFCLWGMEGFTSKFLFNKTTTEHLKIKEAIASIGSIN